jgi:hypothetical protein
MKNPPKVENRHQNMKMTEKHENRQKLDREPKTGPKVGYLTPIWTKKGGVSLKPGQTPKMVKF